MAHGSGETAHSDTVTDTEIRAMAQVLARRYCGEAIDVALHFADEHQAIGDIPRACIWNRVAESIREPRLRTHK